MVALLFVIVLPGAAVAGAPGGVGEWLERMTGAVTALDYEGTFVYEHEGLIDSVQVVHKVDASGEHERLTALSGVAREVLRDNNKVTCILPDDRMAMSGSHPYNPFAGGQLSSERLAPHYRLSLGGVARVAGLPAREIVIDPQDQFRYGYRLWLEEGSAMPLKSQLRDPAGRVLEQVMFTEIHLGGSVPAERLKPTMNGEQLSWVREDEDEGGGNVDAEWRVHGLPAGFAMTMSKRHPMPGSSRPVEHLVFSDGLSAVSVYIEEPGPPSGHDDTISRQGAVHAYRTRRAGHLVTVVGEVPPVTLRAIGDSLAPRRGEEKR